MPAEKRWLVFYTRARWEKKVYDYLLRFGFEPWLPLVTEMHQWSDRRKKVQAPLFRSYIFVFEVPDSIPEILKVPGIAWNIRLAGEPAFLRSEEKALIQRILDTGYSVKADMLDQVKPGDPVEIQDGPMKGITGEVVKGEKGQVIVRLDSLDQVIRIQVPANLITKR